MPVYATARTDLTAYSFNCTSARGFTLRKDRRIPKGTTLEVNDFFTSTGLATHGSPCVTVQDAKGNYLRLHAASFDFSGDPLPTWVDKALQRQLRYQRRTRP